MSRRPPLTRVRGASPVAYGRLSYAQRHTIGISKPHTLGNCADLFHRTLWWALAGSHQYLVRQAEILICACHYGGTAHKYCIFY